MAAPRCAVTAAIVSWNTRELLDTCLRSLEPEVRAGVVHVVVLDNASTDGSSALVAERFPWAELVASEVNLGFGAAVNAAAARARSPWLLAANADTELTPGALGVLLAAGERDPGAGIVAPRLVLGDGSVQHSVHPFPTLGVALAFNAGLGAVVPGLGDRLALEGHWDAGRERRVDWAIGACLLIRREAFASIGGFPAEHWMYAEDLDLAWRAARAGWATRYAPQAVVRHVGAAATTQAWGEGVRQRWMQASYGWMWRTRGPLRTRAYALVSLLGAAARFGLCFVPGPGSGRRAQRSELRAWIRLHGEGLTAPPARIRQWR